MSSASLISAADLARRDRLVLVTCAAFLTLLAWLAMAAGHGGLVPSTTTLAAPHHHPAGSTGLLLVFAMWMLMMVAMMLPPVMPWILLIAGGVRRRAPGRSPLSPTAAFVIGYFTAWLPYAAVAAVAQVVLQNMGWLAGADLRAGRMVAGVLLLLAGLFQLTPLKTACLKHCRSPLSFFLSRWRDGPSGAWSMGFRHGLFCLGCCWALMAISFGLGVMNLAWMALLTVLLCIEKIAPAGHVWSRLAGAGFLVWGAALIALG